MRGGQSITKQLSSNRNSGKLMNMFISASAETAHPSV